MSFLSNLKNEIIKQPYKNACCRRAMLDGVLFAKGTSAMEYVSINLENNQAIEYICALINEFYGKIPEINTLKKGGRCKKINFKSQSASKYIASLDLETVPFLKKKCSLCSSAFLRGIFLACGRITDPEKQYRLEIAPVSHHNKILDFLIGLGMTFSLAERRGEKFIYTGNSAVAEDFFAAAGMNSTAFFLMNSKIESDFKNTANRIRNCETNNIFKTVSASARWVEAIEALEKANLLSTLPEELEKTARLRLEHRDYSLARLAAEFTPAISKPGLSHRLNKIVEISETLLGKNNK